MFMVKITREKLEELRMLFDPTSVNEACREAEERDDFNRTVYHK